MSTLKLKGSTSGYVELTAPATAGDNTITLPTTAGTVAVKDASNNVEVGTGVTIGSPSSNVFTVSTNGSERVRVTSTGSVGIGTDNPADGSKLHLQGGGGLLVKRTSGTSIARFGNTGTVSPNITIYGSSTTNEPYIGCSTDDLTFGTNNTERLRVLAAGGLTFNGDTAAANALDDYEEGTWTPSFQTTNNNASITNTSVSHAVYTKIGNRVFGSARFYALVSSKGTGTVQITGLPFTVPSSNPAQGEVHCTIAFALRFSTAAPISAVTVSNSTRIDLITANTDATTGGIATYMPAANLSLENTNNIISISFSYSVA